MKPKSILLVDDQDVMRHFVAERLTFHGYIVCDVSDRDKATNELKRGFIPDVIIMDIVLNGMSLNEFVINLKNFTDKVIPMILSTCAPDGIRLADQMKAYFLPEAFSTDYLLKTIELCLDH